MAGRAARRTESLSARETAALGAELARSLRPGDAVLVQGELGVGKTTLVRGASRALGITARVSSPTFTIGQRYPGPTPVAHVDLFRVADLAEEEPDLLVDYVAPDMVAFIELPPELELHAIEREVARLARVAARVSLEHAGGDRRLVVIE